MNRVISILATAVMFAASASPAMAQETTGTPSSPATTTTDGKQLPPPEPPFGGVIKPLAQDSKPG